MDISGLIRVVRSSKVLSWSASRIFSVIQPPSMRKRIRVAENNFDVSDADRRKNRADLYYSQLYYSITPEEYYRYHFPLLSDTGRKQYVGDFESESVFEKVTPPKMRKLFKNKFEAYQMLSSYYGRKMIMIEKNEDYNLFDAFCKTHLSFVLKPKDLQQGTGVRKINVSEINDRHSYFNSILDNGGAVIEELVEQDERMAAFHPQSINTVRVVVLNVPDSPQIVACSVRIGTGDSFVDNGCLSCGVDPESGVITSMGRNVHGKGLYLFHPDTGKQILGFQIPEWDALKAMAIEASGLAPEQPVIGWDTALSKNGWVIIEGNTNPAIQTLSAEGVGARDLLNLIKVHLC